MSLNPLFNPFKLYVMKIRIVLAMTVFVVPQLVKAQEATPETPKKLPEIGIGVGITSFQGDIGKNNKITDLSKLRSAYNLRIEQPVTSFLNVQLNGLYGKLAESERSSTSNLNFQSPLIQADVHAIFKFDNGFLLPKDAFVSPYLGAGIGYTKFDPHADLKNKNGQVYNYWTDGSIRDLPQADSNFDRSTILYRDYTYETKLTDPAKNYKRSTFSVPLLAGVKFKLSPSWAMSVNYTYYVTFTDYIDNFADGGNDRFWFASFGIHYNLAGNNKEEDEVRFANVDFSKISKLDSDGDGVSDEDDQCQGTPKGVEVTSKGCPKDQDNDGIPDHLDKQKNSPLGAVVDPDGVAVDDATIERNQLMRDSLATERSEVFLQNPSLRSLQAIDAKIAESGGAGKKPLPTKFVSADANHDGIIQSSEITAVIDGFFEGSNDFTVERINELIDFFFEQ
jgi:opacity protein-like surface antigen